MIVKHTLPNGLRVVAEQISYVRSIAMGIWVRTGSRYENKTNNGTAHFLEHMFFKGTEKRTAFQLAESFDAIGGHVNAFTSKEMTCFYVKVLDDNFAKSLEILADMFLHSTFDEKEIEKEKKVVIEEIRMVEDTPDDLVHDLLAEASYETNALRLPIIGTVDNVKKFSRQDLLQYKDTHYHDKNVVISLAGNLPPDYLNLIETTFAHHNQTHSIVNDSIHTDKTVFSSGIKTKQKNTEQAHICLGMEGIAIDDPRIYEMTLLNNVLGGNMSSRLFQGIREERGLAYSVYSYHSSHQTTGLFVVYAGTAHGQEDEVVFLIKEALQELVKNGISSPELEKSKEQIKSSLMLGLESTNNRMSRLGRNELLLGYHWSLDELVEKVDQITLEQIHELAKVAFSSPQSLAIISSDGNIPASF